MPEDLSCPNETSLLKLTCHMVAGLAQPSCSEQSPIERLKEVAMDHCKSGHMTKRPPEIEE